MDGGLVANNPCGELLQDMSVESDAMELRVSTIIICTKLGRIKLNEFENALINVSKSV